MRASAIAAFVVLWTACVASTKVSRAEEPIIAPQTPARIVDPMAREILSIRRAMGGTVLKGTPFDSAGTTTGSESKDVPATVTDEQRFADVVERLAERPRESGLKPVHTSTAPTVSRSFNRRMVLRNSARRLDELAAEFEDQELYQQADELRGVAARYRAAARDGSQPSGAEVDLRREDAPATSGEGR